MEREDLPGPGIHSLGWHALGLRGMEYTSTDPACYPLEEEDIAQELGYEA